MAAERDRNGQWEPGTSQVYPTDGTVRIYRHTLVGLDAETGMLRPLSDVLGLRYVGVSGAASVVRVTPGAGMLSGDSRGLLLVTVLHEGELEFLFDGTSTDLDLGLTAYCVDDETVTTDPAGLEAAYAVGRVTRRTPGSTDRVRVRIELPPVDVGRSLGIRQQLE
jgi:hypothetical protein